MNQGNNQFSQPDYNIQNNNPSFEQTPKKKGKIGLIVLIVALILIIATTIIVINVNSNKGNSSNGNKFNKITDKNVSDIVFNINDKSIKMPCTVQDLIDAGLTATTNVEQNVNPSLISIIRLISSDIEIEISTKNLEQTEQPLKKSLVTNIQYSNYDKNTIKNTNINFNGAYKLLSTSNEMNILYPEAFEEVNSAYNQHRYQLERVEKYYKEYSGCVEFRFRINKNDFVEHVEFNIDLL